jgi:hypothetical protein
MKKLWITNSNESDNKRRYNNNGLIKRVNSYLQNVSNFFKVFICIIFNT